MELIFKFFQQLIFLSLKIYTGITTGQWVYIIADPIFILAAIKNYEVDVKKSDIKMINFTTISILSGIIFILSLLAKYYYHINQFEGLTFIDWNLLFGLFLFAIGLSTTNNEQKRYILSVIGLVFMVMGAFMKTYVSFYNKEIHGLEISYAILPLTVLVYNLKLWDQILNKTNGRANE